MPRAPTRPSAESFERSSARWSRPLDAYSRENSRGGPFKCPCRSDWMVGLSARGPAYTMPFLICSFISFRTASRARMALAPAISNGVIRSPRMVNARLS